MTVQQLLVPAIMCLLFSVSSCSGQEKPATQENVSVSLDLDPMSNIQVADFIRHIHKDHDGHFWMGTNAFGIVYFNGENLAYFSSAEGFGGEQITGIAEDSNGHLWIATDQGVVKIDKPDESDQEMVFTNYNGTSLFDGHRFWSIYVDSEDIVWAGSATAVYQFDGEKWTPFEIPYPEAITGDFITAATSMAITEDESGHIWFSTMGFGAFKYNGRSFKQYTESDGLTSNTVDDILVAQNGHIWFGTRFGGVSCYDGEQFETFSQQNGRIGGNEVCAVFEDSQGNIWFSSEGYGVYRYDGTSLKNFRREQGLLVGAVQAIAEDSKGRIWVGGGGGLYRLEGESFINIIKDGPWD